MRRHSYSLKRKAPSLEEIKKVKRKKMDKELDKALEGTFPASDATAKY